MPRDAVIVGSGAAGSVVAWELTRHGWSVTMLERGRHMRSGLGQLPSGELGTRYSSDELKSMRALGFPDGQLEPYTFRTQQEAGSGKARSAQGALGQLGAAVGGTTLHYNAKFPRIFKDSFKQLSRQGPVEGAQVADWPIDYAELAPYYDFVEQQVGVSGDREAMPALTRTQAPRSRPFAMPPNPTTYVATLLAEAARESGWTAYSQPAAVNSEPFDGRPACVSCGLCSGFGCPISARGDALVSWLNAAVHTGQVQVVPRAFAYRIDTTRDGGRASGVRYVDADGRRRQISADIVVVAGSPINTARLLLMSASSAHPRGLGNGSDQVGRNMMFHNFTLAAALLPEDVHPNRGQSNSMELDDLVGPFTGPKVTALGVPYVNGGIVQVGGGVPLMTEAALFAGYLGYGEAHKQTMKVGPLHARIAGSQMLGEDLPQAENRVDLDPGIKDYRGFPAARITYSPHRHEQAAALLLGPRMEAWHARVRGAIAAGIVPYPLISTSLPGTFHLAGTARMGDDPSTSVCDPEGRLHEVPNMYITDASLFPTFPGFNPTNTIMSNALRIACGITGAQIQAGG
jgi:choline dehydrogenase-like flavoprotein